MSSEAQASLGRMLRSSDLRSIVSELEIRTLTALNTLVYGHKIGLAPTFSSIAGGLKRFLIYDSENQEILYLDLAAKAHVCRVIQPAAFRSI